MVKVKVFDNGGETIDRYTVFIGDNVFAMSENPLSPVGINMCIEASLKDMIEEELPIVPTCLVEAITRRIDELGN